MKAARIHKYGPPDVIVIDEVERPAPGEGEALVRVASAGVGPWDALIREKQGEVDAELPITLGSDLSGVIAGVGPGVTAWHAGDEIYGVTNSSFVGAYAEYAVVKANMIARKPAGLSFEEAASAPVVAVTPWQMLFEYANAKAGQSVLIQGAGGNVGAYAVQLAAQAGLDVYAVASAKDAEYVKRLGAGTVIDHKKQRFEDAAPKVDIVLDMVGGETQKRSFDVIKPGGILVSVVSQPDQKSSKDGVRAVFFLVEVTTERLEKMTELFEQKKLETHVGTVLKLDEARKAHDMLAGAPHEPGKILLRVGELG